MKYRKLFVGSNQIPKNWDEIGVKLWHEKAADATCAALSSLNMTLIE